MFSLQLPTLPCYLCLPKTKVIPIRERQGEMCLLYSWFLGEGEGGEGSSRERLFASAPDQAVGNRVGEQFPPLCTWLLGVEWREH